MTILPDAREFQTRLQRLESLLDESERSADPGARARTREVVRAVLDLHAAGLGRILELLSATGRGDGAVIDRLAADDLVAGLLLLHGLHPRSPEDRVAEALDRVRPYLRSHGGSVELLGFDDGVVRLWLGGDCDGCPSSSATMRKAVEDAIIARAPDVLAIEFEGGDPVRENGHARVALKIL